MNHKNEKAAPAGTGATSTNHACECNPCRCREQAEPVRISLDDVHPKYVWAAFAATALAALMKNTKANGSPYIKSEAQSVAESAGAYADAMYSLYVESWVDDDE